MGVGSQGPGAVWGAGTVDTLQPWLSVFCLWNQVLCWAQGAKGKELAGQICSGSENPQEGGDSTQATETLSDFSS